MPASASSKPQAPSVEGRPEKFLPSTEQLRLFFDAVRDGHLDNIRKLLKDDPSNVIRCSGPNPWEFIVNHSKHTRVFFLSFCFKSVVLLLSLSTTIAFAQNPVPQIVGPVAPSAVAPGSGGFTLTVYGANFVSGAVVNWNGQKRFTTFVSARELQAQILAPDIAQNTAGTISVTNPPPGGGNSSASCHLPVVD
jgi:hypothetical protein